MRTIGTGHRRCVRDYERPRHHDKVTVRWSMIRLVTRRLERSEQFGNGQ